MPSKPLAIAVQAAVNPSPTDDVMLGNISTKIVGILIAMYEPTSIISVLRAKPNHSLCLICTNQFTLFSSVGGGANSVLYRSITVALK